MSEKIIDLSVTRRALLKGGTAAAAVASVPGLQSKALADQITKLENEGWEKHPVACTMCGAFCGLLAMKKKGAPISEQNVRIYPNPSHPQRGYCGRSAATMWVWNHPLRLRKPLKRVGERGEGKFVEVTWDEALDAIAGKLKKIVLENGESSVTTTSHSFSGFSKWLSFPLGSPNNIGHQSSCNAAGINGRDLVFGKGFNGAGKMEPDYANLRYIILLGRSMGAAMGALHTLNIARAKGARVVSVDPRMPDMAYGDAEWVPIRPGTDNAFLMGIVHEMIVNKTADFDFIERHTNGAYLIKENGRPVTQDQMVEGGSKTMYAVSSKDGRISFRGPKKDAAGNNIGFDEDPNFRADLFMKGSVKLLDGSSIPVKTAFMYLREIALEHSPEKVFEITGIRPEVLRQIAHDFTNLKGVIDDGWYSSKNGLDVEVYQLISIVNTLNGNIDVKGGLVVTASPGIKIPSVAAGKGPNGETWKMAPEKRIDKIIYPEAEGTFKVALEAAVTGKPYPIKAAFFVGTTMFQREANTKELMDHLKKLELCVVQDVMPQELVDYADWVLPATFFMERKDISNVKWARDGSIYLSDPQLTPPEGCEARHDVWILLEILRRAFPERAARVGYKSECKTAEEFDRYFDAFTEAGYKKLLTEREMKKPGEAARIMRDMKEQGWSKIVDKEYGIYPYSKPFGTPSGKPEIYCFKVVGNEAYEKAIKPVTGHVQSPAYTAPKPNSNEFVLVSGKNCNSTSGLNMFLQPTRFLGDRTVWMNPEDAARLGIANREFVEIEGLDTGWKAKAQITVTKKVVAGAVFAFGFSGGNRCATVTNPEYQFVKEGINSHWFAKGYAKPIFGTVANNGAVRIHKVRG